MMESTGAAIPFQARARAADGVLFRELIGESVIFSADSENYFGLDEVGTRIWGALGESPTIQAAFDHGINLVDTAPAYGFGHSEEIVGKAIAGAR